MARRVPAGFGGGAVRHALLIVGHFFHSVRGAQMAGKLTLGAAALAVMVSYGMSAQWRKRAKEKLASRNAKNPSRRLGESGIA
jgi:hypothetical protein